MRSKSSKDSYRGFQVNSEISVRKALPTFGQTVDVTPNFFCLGTKPALKDWWAVPPTTNRGAGPTPPCPTHTVAWPVGTART